MKNIVSIFLLLAHNSNNNNSNIAKKDSVDLELLLTLLECINFELTEAEKCFDKEGRYK